MGKIKDTAYDIFVKKLSLYLGKTFTRSDLFRYWLLSGGAKSRFPYGLSKAKNQEKLVLLGSGIYQVSSLTPSSTFLDDAYWDILSIIIRQYTPSGALIAHEKSLELHMKNFEIPSTIVLYTRNTSKRVKVGPYVFHLRSLKSGEKTSGKNMYSVLEQYSTDVKIGNHTFHTLGIDSTLLDVASLKLHSSGISEDLLLRFIRKYENSYDRNILGEIVSHRYIRAMNRIRSLAKIHGFQRLYVLSLDIIKKEGGGCFVSI